jgi:hypothetical protein
MSSYPQWSGSHNARWILARCWDLGLRPPPGEYRLFPRRGQCGITGDPHIAPAPLSVEHSTSDWHVVSSYCVTELRRLWRLKRLQCTLRSSRSSPHRIDHYMASFRGIPLLPPDAIALSLGSRCASCGIPLQWAGMPLTEEDSWYAARAVHPDPACSTWAAKHTRANHHE